jgi:hypothetical protein
LHHKYATAAGVAFRYAQASTLAPLIYLELLCSAAIGCAVFGDIPGVISGSALSRSLSPP